MSHTAQQDAPASVDGSANEASNSALVLDALRDIQARLALAHRLAFTRTEAANVLGLRPSTIDQLVRRGLLRPNRATRRPLFSRAEIERFLLGGVL
jgi:DNA-directed RNA polymerase specialized sigma24 family protein